MQEENSPVFLSIYFQSMKASLNKFELDYTWIYWTLYYISFIFIALFCAVIFVNYLNPNHTDVNSARYLLSSLIQSEAAIIAIVITLTLVAVQLTASAYTPRVANNFASSPHMYLILGIYIISIAYSAILLQLLNGNEGIVIEDMEFLISLAYWLTIILAIALIPYIYHILELLKPETFIRRKTNQLSKIAILQYENIDHLNSIFDVLHNSIMKYDTTTIRQGLNAVTLQITNQVSGINTPDENSKMIKIYCAHLERCARQAIDLNDEEILSIILDQFEKVGSHCAKNEFDNPTWQVITIIVEVEKLIAVKDLPSSLNQVTELIKSIGIISIKNNFHETKGRILFCLENIAKHATNRINPLDEYSIYNAIYENSIDYLLEIISIGISMNQLRSVNEPLSYLKSIGKYSLKKGNIPLLCYIVNKILDLWLIALPNLEDTSCFYEVSHLAVDARESSIKKDSFDSDGFEIKILEIGILSLEKGSESDQNGVASLLADMRIVDDVNFQILIQYHVPYLTEQKKEHCKNFLKLQNEIYQERLQDLQLYS